MTAPQTGNDTRGRGSGPLNWLLDELVDKVGSIRKAVVLSGDGLPTGTSKDLTREDGEHLAAVASGFHSLAKGVGRRLRVGPGAPDGGGAGRGLPVRHGHAATAAAWPSCPTPTPTSARSRTR